MDTNELNTNTDKKILLVSVSPFGFSEDNMQIYNLVSNIVISGSKCKLAILCLDINLPFSLKSYSINDIPYIDNFTEKNLFQNIEIVDWGEVPNFDMIVNATSVGLKEEDNINIDFSLVGKDKFFFDVIYNPSETNFLKIGKNSGNLTLNGKMMFIYQAFSAFRIWHGVEPEINQDVIKLLD